MKKNILKLVALFLLATATVVIPARSFGEDPKGDATADSAEPAKPKRDTVPFRGKVGAVDKVAKTFMIGERTFHLTADSKVMKDGKPATLDDAVVGEEVGGQARKSEDGKLTVTSVRFGPKPEVEAKPKKDKTAEGGGE